jgi:hypothetical protein
MLRILKEAKDYCTGDSRFENGCHLSPDTEGYESLASLKILSILIQIKKTLQPYKGIQK